MNRLADRLMLLLGLALCAGLLGAAPATAASFNVTCGISGTLHTDPPLRLGGGGGGAYTFDDLPVPCEGTIDGEFDVFGMDISTLGTYNGEENCNNATFNSMTASGTVVNSISGNVGKTVDFPYHVEMAVPLGYLGFHSPAAGSGGVVMVPTGPQSPWLPDPPNAWACNNAFWVTGEFQLRT